MDISHIRLLNQQLVSSRFTDVHDLVAWMGMVQAQEYKMMRWAVGMRLREPSMRAFREAYDAGSIVRSHLFRCTWQLVAAKDYRWMLSLCADKLYLISQRYKFESESQQLLRKIPVLAAVFNKSKIQI